MLIISQDFKDCVRDSVRRIVGRVTVDYTDPFLDQSISVTTNGNANVSYPEQTTNVLEVPSRKWATLDGSWLLDGTQCLMPENGGYEVGWWGNVLAGVGGAFAAPYPMLTVTFFARPIKSLKVVGDNQKGEFPIDFTIKAYNSLNTLLHTEDVIGNTLVKWTKDITQVPNITKLTLEVKKWSHAGRVVKILEFFTSFQEVYTGDDLFFISLLEEREFSNGSLPVGNVSSNEVNIRINNIDGKFDGGNITSSLYGLVKPNRRVRPELGVELSDNSIEYVPLGEFWTGEWKASEKEVYAETTARDRLELFSNTTYSTSQVLQNTTLYQLAVNIFTDAGLVEGQYYVDPELQDYAVPYGWLDTMSHREALRLIAEAGLGQLYCDRDGIPRLEGPSYLAVNKTISQVTITRDDYFTSDTPPNWNEIKNYIEVETQPLKPSTNAEEVYISNEAESIGAGATKTVTIFYNDKPVIEAVASLSGQGANTTITASTYYAWGANITVRNTGGTSDTFTIVVNGKPLRVQGAAIIIASNIQSINDNGKLVYRLPSNPLIQTKVIAQIIVDKLLASYKDPRRDIELNWRGNPALDLGDRFTAPDSKITTGQFSLVSQSLEWDGGLTSTIKGRRAI